MLVHLFDREVEVDADSKEGAMLSNSEGHIVIRDVHFRYPTRPGSLFPKLQIIWLIHLAADVPVLRGLNLECKPGQFIALVGESG